MLGHLLVDLEDREVVQVLADVNALAARCGAEGCRVNGVYRELAAAVAEHLAERVWDALWAVRFPIPDDLPPVD